ncbi:MAG: DNA polymerase III subunit delta [Pseudomonadota bacterium]
MKFAGAKAEQFSAKPDPSAWAVLLFGEDDGVAADAARALIAAWSPKGQEPELIRLEEDAVRRDPASLFDALEAQSLLGEARIIRIQTSGDKIAKILGDAVTDGDGASGAFAARLIVTAGPLQKKSKLRAAFEGARSAAALHFFADEEADLLKLARTRLSSAGAEIEDDALHALVGGLPGHRGLAGAEIEKVALYAYGLDHPIALDDIRALGAAEADAVVHETIEAALDGNGARALSGLDRLEATAASPITLFRALHREAARMLDAHTLGGGDGMRLRPPVYKSQWPAFRDRLAKWPAQRLSRILERLYDAELASKEAGALGWPQLRVLIADLSRAASK